MHGNRGSLRRWGGLVQFLPRGSLFSKNAFDILGSWGHIKKGREFFKRHRTDFSTGDFGDRSFFGILQFSFFVFKRLVFDTVSTVDVRTVLQHRPF